MKKALVLAGVLVGGLAFAQLALNVDIFNARPVLFSQPIHIGPALGPNRVFPSSTSRVTRLLRADYTIDFASATITCVDSAAQTLTGARTGDICLVSPPAGSTANTSFTCRVNAANQVTVRYCPAGTAADPASGSYNVLVLSNQ
jgi:hypothetical protein